MWVVDKFDIDDIIREEKNAALIDYGKAEHLRIAYGEDTAGAKIHEKAGKKHMQKVTWLMELKERREKDDE